jgi:hypothetical protein
MTTAGSPWQALSLTTRNPALGVSRAGPLGKGVRPGILEVLGAGHEIISRFATAQIKNCARLLHCLFAEGERLTGGRSVEFRGAKPVPEST